MAQLKEDTRQKVLERDGRRCQFCGVTDEQHKDERDRSLDIHHIIPRRAGGSDDPENLIPVCVECHRTLESTQGDALERIKEDSKNTNFEKIAKEKQRVARENHRKDEEIEQLKEQIDDIYCAFRVLAEASTKTTLYVVHQTEFTTSSLLYVGTDRDKAYEKFSEADQHATMETANVTIDDWVDSVRDSTLKSVEEESEPVGNWLQEFWGNSDD